MSSDGHVIEVQEVTKTYRIGVGRARIREMTPPPFDRVLARLLPKWWSRNCFDALDNVSLVVPRGSCVAIVGHNGAGKTTLLRLIAGVTSPTRGSIHTAGKVAALLDVVVGFHPDLTGRENLILLGGVLGLQRKDIDRRTPDILEFAEIPEAADTPIKRYSAGMIARLAFAAITAMDIEVLLVDEVLAVGDAAFQRKCVDWLDGFRERGGTLLFVSHNLALVRSMTERAVWLDHGQVVADAETPSVLGDYAHAMEMRESSRPISSVKQVRRSMQAARLRRWGAGGARVDEVHIEEPADEPLVLTIHYEPSGIAGDRICVGLVDETGREVGGTLSPHVSEVSGSPARCEISPVPLNEGVYFPVVGIISADGTVRDYWTLERAIVVDRRRDDSAPRVFGAVRLPANWSVPDGVVGFADMDSLGEQGAAGESQMRGSNALSRPSVDSDG